MAVTDRTGPPEAAPAEGVLTRRRTSSSSRASSFRSRLILGTGGAPSLDVLERALSPRAPS